MSPFMTDYFSDFSLTCQTPLISVENKKENSLFNSCLCLNSPLSTALARNTSAVTAYISVNVSKPTVLYLGNSSH